MSTLSHGIDHATEEEFVRDLATRLQSGDPDDRQEFILYFVPEVKRQARAISSRKSANKRQMYEDLVSMGLLTVCQLARKVELGEIKNVNLRAYINQRIHFELLEGMSEMENWSSLTASRFQDLNKLELLPAMTNITTEEWEELLEINNCFQHIEYEELLDVALTCCTAEDRRLLFAAHEGASQLEMAEHFNLPMRTIERRVSELKTQVVEALDAVRQ